MSDRKIAGCPRCEAPIVSTFAFRGAEWYCLDCGKTVAWFSEISLPNTKRNRERLAKREAEFDPIAHALLVPFSKLRDCDRCQANFDDDHCLHVNEAEIEADKQAREWIANRVLPRWRTKVAA